MKKRPGRLVKSTQKPYNSGSVRYLLHKLDGPYVIQGVFSLPTSPQIAASTRNSGWLLRDYLGGPENSLAHGVYESFSDGRYNPVVLFGPICSGKSILLRALHQRWIADTSSNATLLSGSDLARDFATATETDSLEELREQLTSQELLIVDDVHQLKDKPTAQLFLVQIIDRMLASNGQLLFSCCQSPAVISEFHPSLRSRLTGGLAIPIALPSLNTRYAILSELAKLHGVSLPVEVLELLATDEESGLSLRTVPQLNHAILQLKQETLQTEQPLDRDLAVSILTKDKSCTTPTIRAITKAVGRHFGIRTSDIKSSSRRRGIVRARGVAVFLSRHLTDQSLEQIGKYFGNRDHTTILHAFRQTEELRQTDATVREAIKQLQHQLIYEPK